MGHGGRRAGAGRKPGVITKKTREAAERLIADGLTPLDYMLGVLRGTLQHACSSSAAPRKLAAAVIVSSHAAGAAAGVAAAAAGGEASSRGGAFCGSGALRSRTTHQPAARPPQPQPSG